MREDIDLKEFAEEQIEEVNAVVGEDQREDEFTRLTLEYLTDAGEVVEPQVCFHQVKGVRVHGYAFSVEDECVDLFCVQMTQSVPPASVPRTDVETAFKRLRAFLSKALGGYHEQLVNPSPAYDMASQIYGKRAELKRARLYFLTDGLVSPTAFEDENISGLAVSHHIWDLRRIFRLLNSGGQREPLEIDFSSFGGPIPCLQVPGATGEYSALLLVFPGNTLADIYERFGARLLERNVRSFLQAKGKVNKKIRDTIVKEPTRFFAYNNGISATASEVRYAPLPTGGGVGMVWARDFQIVNGGQTTASIYHTRQKDKADVSQVAVQAKLSVVKPSKLNELVPLISRYANSQNKVSETDLSANDPFHISLEQISRTVFTPISPASPRQTIWFYERARGQYADAKTLAGTAAKRKEFEAVHPPAQRFSKADLAKFENTWLQLPHVVSRGGEKNFKDFADSLVKRNITSADERYFKQLVAKGILFRRTEQIVHGLKFGGYRANIVTYSIAYLSHCTQMRLDLDRIWQDQDIPPAVADALEQIAKLVHGVITNPPGGKNVTEWCKQGDCWEGVKQISFEWPVDLLDALQGTPEDSLESPASLDEDVLRLRAVPPEKWFELADWGKETHALRPRLRKAADLLGSALSRGQAIQPRLVTLGIKVLAEAKALGALESAVRPKSTPAPRPPASDDVLETGLAGERRPWRPSSNTSKEVPGTASRTGPSTCGTSVRVCVHLAVRTSAPSLR